MHARILPYHQAHILAALEVANGLGMTVSFQSPPQAMRLLGPQVLRALFAPVQAPHEVVIDCGTLPGHALAAMRAGFTSLLFSGDDVVRIKLQSMEGMVLAVPATRLLDLKSVENIESALEQFLHLQSATVEGLK